MAKKNFANLVYLMGERDGVLVVVCVRTVSRLTVSLVVLVVLYATVTYPPRRTGRFDTI